MNPKGYYLLLFLLLGALFVAAFTLGGIPAFPTLTPYMEVLLIIMIILIGSLAVIGRKGGR